MRVRIMRARTWRLDAAVARMGARMGARMEIQASAIIIREPDN
jgi:hypothetical protein